MDDCQRNRFQIGYLCGEDVYAWFDRPLVRHEYRQFLRAGQPAEVMPHQYDLADAGLTYHYQIFAAEMGVGKSLAAQMVIESSGVDLVWWAGPKTSIPNIKREFKLWGFPFDRIQVEFFTYEGLVRVMDEWDGSQTLPRFFVADESSRCKNDTSQRSKACQKLADLIRNQYGYEGYVLEMSGTPSPKTPCDWWGQCLSADTWVLTESGPRQICQLIGTPVQVRVRDKLCATNGFCCTGARQLYHLETEEGYALKATADHRFFRVDDGWCPLSDLRPGHRIALANSGDAAWPGVGTFGDGYLLGFLVGDGTLYHKDGGLHANLPVYGRKRSLVPTLLAYLPTPYEPTGTDPVKIHHWYVSGLARQFGFTPEKAIPADFERLASSDCVRGLLRGLFDTDGSVDRNRLRVTVSQACRARLLVVQRLLSYFGIHSTLQFKRKVAAKCSRINGRQIASAEAMYVLHVTGDDAAAFHARVGFSHPDKARTLASRLMARHHHSPRRWATVRTVATAGVESTYDVEVPSEHCFAANGLLAHNCEIAWPGFLKEGSRRAMEERLAFMVTQQFDAGAFKKRIGWKDDERKCAQCGATCEEGPHDLDGVTDPADYHKFVPSTNEVAYLYDRLKGLAVIKHKKDCLSLPEKRYRKVVCKPTASVLRVAESLVRAAPNAVTGMTRLRELSDGFQYREQQEGTTKCTHCTDGTVAQWVDAEEAGQVYLNVSMLPPEVVGRLVKETVPCPLCHGERQVPKMVRFTREVPCPKDAALKMLLDENEEVGRIVVFAGFTGSVDRIVKLCLKEKWDVVRCDQGNFQVFAAKSDGPDGALATEEEPLDYWANMDHGKVAFVANPESGGMSLTLVEARMAVYWSNSWKPEYRVQSEDRIHRKGMDENLGCTIVDLIHLPSDGRVLDVIRANRKLELMTMGEILEGVDWKDAGEEGEMSVEEMTA